VIVCAANVRKCHTYQFSKPGPVKRRSENNRVASSLSFRNENKGSGIRDFAEWTYWPTELTDQQLQLMKLIIIFLQQARTTTLTKYLDKLENDEKVSWCAVNEHLNVNLEKFKIAFPPGCWRDWRKVQQSAKLPLQERISLYSFEMQLVQSQLLLRPRSVWKDFVSVLTNEQHKWMTNEFRYFCRTIPIAVALKLNCSVFRNSNSCRVLPFYRIFLH